jgi:hypothetical protein
MLPACSWLAISPVFIHHPQSFEYVAEQQGRLCARSKIATIDLR